MQPGGNQDLNEQLARMANALKHDANIIMMHSTNSCAATPGLEVSLLLPLTLLNTYLDLDCFSLL